MELDFLIPVPQSEMDADVVEAGGPRVLPRRHVQTQAPVVSVPQSENHLDVGLLQNTSCERVKRSAVLCGTHFEFDDE